MSNFQFSVHIFAATLVIAASYAAIMSLFSKEVNQTCVLVNFVLAVVSSFVMVLVSTVSAGTLSLSEFPLLLQLVLFALSVFAFFFIRPKKWSLDAEIVKKVRIITYFVFGLSVFNWLLILGFFTFIYGLF